MYPYDRQPYDTAKSWRAFSVYRDMGSGRSIEKASEILGYKYPAHLYRWSSQHNWVERCQAFDQDEAERQSQQMQAMRLKRREQFEAEAWSLAQEYRAKAKGILHIPIMKKVATDDGQAVFMPTDKWSLKDSVKLDQHAVELMLIATGLSKVTSEADQLNNAIGFLKSRGFLVVNPFEEKEIANHSPEFIITTVPEADRDIDYMANQDSC